MPYRFFRLVVPLLFFSITGFSQWGGRVSLGSKPQVIDTARVNLLIEETYTLRETDLPKALTSSLEAIALSKQIGYRKGMARATGSLGWIYYRKGDFVKALVNSIEALKISEQIGDQVEVARCLNNVAAIYYEEKQYDKSLDNFKKAMYVAKQLGDTRTFARSLNNIAHLFVVAWNNLDSAQAYATQALIISEKTGDHYNGSFSNRTLGDMYSARKNFDKALKHYFRSLELSQAVSNSLKVATWHRIAEVYMGQQRIKDAIAILQKNIEVASQHGYREELARCYQLLAECHRRDGDYSGAFDYLQRYATLHDSIYNQQNSRRLAIVQSQFDLDLKQAQIELLTKDTQLNKKEISHQRIQIYAAIGGLIAILLIASLLFYGNRRVNRTNILLERQKDELAYKNQEVELKSKELELHANQLARINATKDKLFSIIGHDFRSPLNGLKGILALVENKNLSQKEFASVAGTLRANLDSVSTNLENLLQWSLAQLHGIQTNPVKINVQSLVEEHITLFQELAKAKRIRLENEISEILFAFADENHTRLVLRNLINNAIKFTPPGGAIKISNQQENPFVKIMVADTGVGMEPKRLRTLFQRAKHASTEGTNQERGAGIGLMLCQEFVETNGGRLTVASELGKGSVFSFTLKAA